MDSILSLFVGNGACDAGLAYLYLEANQIFEEDDPINHGVLFKPHPGLNVPRALFIGDNQELYASLQNTKVKEKETQQQLQEIQQLESPEYYMTRAYLKEVHIDRSQYQYIHKRQAIETIHSTPDRIQVQQIEDSLVHELEQMSRCNGFQLLIDVDNYASLGKCTLEILRDQCPKSAILCSQLSQEGVWKEKYHGDINFLNRMLSLMHSSEFSTVVVPFNLPLRSDYWRAQPGRFDHYQQFSFLYSMLTLPFTVQENQVGFESFMHRMSIFRECNILNLMTRIPGENDLPEHNIINHKKYLQTQPYLKPNYMERIIRYEPIYKSFAESYSMRGLTQHCENAPSALGLDIRIIDDVFAYPSAFRQDLLNDHVIKNYGNVNEQGETQLRCLPFHLTAFSNECYKYSLKNYQNMSQQITHKTFTQFEKDGYKKDDHLELLQQFESKVESYGGIEDDDDDLSD